MIAEEELESGDINQSVDGEQFGVIVNGVQEFSTKRRARRWFQNRIRIEREVSRGKKSWATFFFS